MIGDPDLNHSKLKQSHQALMAKLEVLNKLDSEILQLLNEIEQADTFTDKIQYQALKGEGTQLGGVCSKVNPV